MGLPTDEGTSNMSNSDEERSFADIAFCFNCKNYNPKNKLCESYDRPQNPTDTCAFFDEGSKYIYEEWVKVQKVLINNEIQPEQKIISLGQRLSQGIPEIKWRVEGIVPERGITLFGGASGSYKTFAAQDLTLSVATGNDFLGQYPTNLCPVLYIDEENGDITLYSRFEDLRKGKQLKVEQLNEINVSIFNNLKLDERNSALILKSLIERTQARLVVIDSMVRCMQGEEDKARDVRLIFETLKQVMNDYNNLSFVILHHTSKAVRNGLNSLRGSGDFAAFADSVSIFDGRKGYALVEQVKNRHLDLSQTKPFIVKLIDEDQGKKLIWLPQDELDSLINQCADWIKEWYLAANLKIFETKDVKKVAEKEGYKHNTIASALNSLIQNGELTKQSKGLYKVVGVAVSESNLGEFNG